MIKKAKHRRFPCADSAGAQLIITWLAAGGSASLARRAIRLASKSTRNCSMGLMDRDYMHEKSRRQRPFSPPPERFKLGTLGMALVFVALLFFLYKAADWKLNQRPAPQPVAESMPQPARHPIPAPALPTQPAYPNSSNAAAGISQVTKCVVNGRTSYGDAACPQGSISSQVTTRANHNLMAAVRPTAAGPAEATATATAQHIVEVQASSFNDAAAKKTECDWLDSQIKHWDSMARQPQGAQTQDWIREQRKQARDRQFRIHCR
ncbi:hypothetical protein [Polaromonas naphthalenivorans]|nr:hypothetical protein [Polaromonas naphthalenivorans]